MIDMGGLPPLVQRWYGPDTGNYPNGADPYYANVSLLLHGDGTFTDHSPTQKTITANGNAQISTAQSKFGGSSMLFDGTGDYLTTPDSADYDFGIGNFTCEFWVYISAAAAFKTIIGQHASSASLWKIDLGSAGTNPRFTATSSSVVIAEYTTTAGTTPANSWAHIAIVRNGTTTSIYVNGVSVAATSINLGAQTLPNVSAVLAIGYDPLNAGRDFNGYLDDLRITKGVARYTANFTPPASAFLDY